MKTKFILWFSTLFLLLLAGEGCEKEKNVPDYYTGKIITLGRTEFTRYNLIEITSAPTNGDLPAGTLIAFDVKNYGEKLEVGNSVQFRIIAYKKWDGYDTTDRIWPQYICDIAPCKN